MPAPTGRTLMRALMGVPVNVDADSCASSKRWRNVRPSIENCNGMPTRSSLLSHGEAAIRILRTEGGIRMRIAKGLFAVILAGGFCVAARLARPANAPQADVKVIEVTAKKYEYNPSPIHVKAGAKVQLKITAVDHTHGFKINLYPDGAPTTGDPGIVFTTKEDCFEIKQGAPVVVEFVAHTPGTYTFKCCKHCGLGHGGMKGQLVVEP